MSLPTYNKNDRRKTFELLPKGAYVIRILGAKEEPKKNGNVYDHIVMKWTCVAEDVRNGKAGKLPNDKLVVGSSAHAKTSGESMDGFLSIPDGLEEELPF